MTAATLAMAIGLAWSCTPLPPHHPYTNRGYYRKGYTPTRGLATGASSAAPRVEGKEFCRDVASKARLRAAGKVQGAVALGVLSGVTAASTIPVVAVDHEDFDSGRLAATMVLGVSAAALGIVTIAVASGYGDTKDLARAAGMAVTEVDDEKANRLCNEALAAWAGGVSPAVPAPAAPAASGSAQAEPAPAATPGGGGGGGTPPSSGGAKVTGAGGGSP